MFNLFADADAGATDRLLTPLGGLIFAMVLSLVAFWLPLLSLVSL